MNTAQQLTRARLIDEHWFVVGNDIDGWRWGNDAGVGRWSFLTAEAAWQDAEREDAAQRAEAAGYDPDWFSEYQLGGCAGGVALLVLGLLAAVVGVGWVIYEVWS